MDSNLLNAYRWHRERGVPARAALAEAANDMLHGRNRYPEGIYPPVSWDKETHGLGYVCNRFGNAGLRYVGRVNVEPRGAGDRWDESGDTGWHTDPNGLVMRDGTGLCYGVVYQLPARGGKARFVAGYEFGGVGGGPTIDFGTIYTSKGNDGGDSVQESEGARLAARAANRLAESAAESEREYQSAWQSGSAYADASERISEAKARLKAVLAERRALKGMHDAPAICGAVLDSVSELWRTICKAREERETFKNGDADELSFWTGEARLRAAFNDGAGEAVLT